MSNNLSNNKDYGATPISFLHYIYVVCFQQHQFELIPELSKTYAKFISHYI